MNSTADDGRVWTPIFNDAGAKLGKVSVCRSRLHQVHALLLSLRCSVEDEHTREALEAVQDILTLAEGRPVFHGDER